MKPETLKRLETLISEEKLQFEILDNNDLSVDYDMSDEEVKELVEIEYGQTSQNVLDLFKCILKATVKLAAEKAKED